jgi:hypothetical protein
MTLGEFGSQCVLVCVAVTKPAEVLADWLGLDAAAVAGLRQDGTV